MGLGESRQPLDAQTRCGRLVICSRCDERAVRELGSESLCAWHLAGVYAMFDPAVFKLYGIGLPAGLRRPEFGPDAVDLCCHACGAAWVGNPCDACRWCALALARHKAWAAESVLTPPAELEPNAHDFDQRLRAWARRLKAHVNAGVITRDEAERALQGVVHRDRAA
jgi:hypothetical protein